MTDLKSDARTDDNFERTFPLKSDKLEFKSPFFSYETQANYLTVQLLLSFDNHTHQVMDVILVMEVRAMAPGRTWFRAQTM